MLRFARISIACGLWLIAFAAAAQGGAAPAFEDPPAPPDDAVPAPPAPGPEPEPPPELEPDAPPDVEPAPDADPRWEEPAPEPEPEVVPQPPEPRAEPAQPEPQAPYTGERYEGQVEPGESEPAYGDDFETEDNRGPNEGGGGRRFSMPGFSVRLELLNWLIEGRLGVELEVEAWKFISVQLVPVFVTDSEPPSFDFSGREDPISQHSNGIGAIAGASLGAGFWLSGTPFQGYVLRATLTNYAFSYESRMDGALIDRVEFTERRLSAFFGSHSRFGFFTIAGGIGLGYELNQQQRCFANAGSVRNVMAATSGCPDEDELQIKIEPDATSVADLNGSLHPFSIEGRISVGVAFD